MTRTQVLPEIRRTRLEEARGGRSASVGARGTTGRTAANHGRGGGGSGRDERYITLHSPREAGHHGVGDVTK